MYDLTSDSSFTDANGREVHALDVVEYQHDARRGILMEAMQDGGAFVLFRDTKEIEEVKWYFLCKVPLIDET